ncbi:MAG: MarR family transcriptional regulator [Deltaproteobacteria bacterium]|nr:MarR family transcriptional regulator [Deltaproteobacteria bacterium]
MKEKIKSIISVMEKLDDIYFSNVQIVGKRLSMKDPFGELTSKQVQAVFKMSRICPCTLTEVARILRISKSSASTLVERLVVKGVIERRQDPNNRRKVLITLSSQARKFQKALEEELVKELVKIGETINPKDLKKWVEVYKAIDVAIYKIYG